MLRSFRRPRLWVFIWAVLIVCVVAVCLLPARDLPTPAIPNIDKIEHALTYAVLAAYAAMLFATVGAQVRAGLGLLALGIGIEVAQGVFTVDRSADVRDVLANTAGIALGLCAGRTRLSGLLQWLDRKC